MRFQSKFIIITTALTLFFECSAFAASKKITIKGKVESGSGYHVAFVDGNGKASLTKLPSSGSFSFKTNKLKNSTLALLDSSGRAFGPIVLSRNVRSKKAYLGFSGKVPSKTPTNINLGKISLKTGFGLVKKLTTENATIFNKKGSLVSTTDSSGNPVGAATGGVAKTTTSSASSLVSIKAGSSSSSVGSDTDADGIIDALDPDIDGDGIVNIADTDFAGNENATFSSLVLDVYQSLNANIGSVTQSQIDNAISGDYGFSIGFWSSLSSDSGITGGHVICSDTNEYCNRTNGTAVYGGFVESNTSLVGQLWRNMNSDGSGYPNLEYLNVRGFGAASAAISPKKGTDAVRPGDTYLINYTNSSRSIVSSKLLMLSPYMVTVPAIKSFTTNSVETQLDYSLGTSMIGTNGNPIVTDSSGIVTITFWRPQRLLYRSETPSSDSDRYRDMGHLKYGVTVEGGSRQFTCATLYSGLSSDLSSSGGLGSGDSPYPDNGAELFPLRDTADDATPSVSRTVSFTVDLRTCLTRAGESVGTKRVVLTARGEELSGGANSSSQQVYITVQ